MQHYLLATSWLICNQFHALSVERSGPIRICRISATVLVRRARSRGRADRQVCTFVFVGLPARQALDPRRVASMTTAQAQQGRHIE
jgi:hypothetical protein